MLSEIRCDAFKSYGKTRDTIVFYPGLNTVLGGAAANNSIGKSTFLLIIDYCFGGETYGKSDIKTMWVTIRYALPLNLMERSITLAELFPRRKL